MKPSLIKITFFLTLAVIASLTSLAQENTNNASELQLDKLNYDFGDITQGETVEHTFTITNTGNAPLLISNVITTCGCTAPSWPKNPIPPNKSAFLKIIFDSRGKMGIQNKVITVISNAANPQSRIKIKANVLPKN